MASISNDPNGRRRILFADATGKRRSIRLGKISKRHADSVKVKLEDLIASTIHGHPPAQETLHWVEKLEAELYDKLASAGLVRSRSATSLEGFLEDYIESRKDVKESTRLVYIRVKKHLLGYFDAQTALRKITLGDADNWRLHLIQAGLADNTIRRSCGVAKQFMTAAERQGLIQKNPFQDLVAAVRANKDKFQFITPEQAQAVLDACPDAEWRLIFGLARYGGLRAVSEVLALKWDDVDMAKERFTVTSSKTAHHEGHETRRVPIFPELRPLFEDALELAEVGSVYCVDRHRHTHTHLRRQLLNIIKRAGLKPWPKLWQNLRSTRETELAETYPVHVAAAWIGNSVAVAAKYYLQVTEEHFQQAAQNPAQKPQECAGNAPKSAPSQKHGRTRTSGNCKDLQEKTTHREKRSVVSSGPYRT